MVLIAPVMPGDVEIMVEQTACHVLPGSFLVLDAGLETMDKIRVISINPLRVDAKDREYSVKHPHGPESTIQTMGFDPHSIVYTEMKEAAIIAAADEDTSVAVDFIGGVGDVIGKELRGVIDMQLFGQLAVKPTGPALPAVPTTAAPTSSPTPSPSRSPTTVAPTPSPSASPTVAPTTAVPTMSPTKAPTAAPTADGATPAPTRAPTTASPTSAAPTSASPTTTTFYCAGGVEHGCDGVDPCPASSCGDCPAGHVYVPSYGICTRCELDGVSVIDAETAFRITESGEVVTWCDAPDWTPSPTASPTAAPSVTVSAEVQAANEFLETVGEFADLLVDVVNASTDSSTAADEEELSDEEVEYAAEEARAKATELAHAVVAAGDQILSSLQNVKATIDADSQTNREVNLEQELSDSMDAGDLAADLEALGALASISLAAQLQQVIDATNAWADETTGRGQAERKALYADAVASPTKAAIATANDLVHHLTSSKTSSNELSDSGEISNQAATAVGKCLNDAKAVLSELRAFESGIGDVSLAAQGSDADGSDELEALGGLSTEVTELGTRLVAAASTVSGTTGTGTGGTAAAGASSSTSEADEVGKTIEKLIKLVSKATHETLPAGSAVQVSTPTIELNISKDVKEGYTDTEGIVPPLSWLLRNSTLNDTRRLGEINDIPFLCFKTGNTGELIEAKKCATVCVPEAHISSLQGVELDATITLYSVAPITGTMAVAARDVIEAESSGRRMEEMTFEQRRADARDRRRTTSEFGELTVAQKASFASPIVDLSVTLSESGQDVDLTNIYPGAVFWVPRLNSSQRAALLNYGGGLREYLCLSDDDCTGLEWDRVGGGECIKGRCSCPMPRSGSACQRELSCRWLDEDDVWQGAGCVLQPDLSTNDEVACACSRVTKSVTVMHELKLKPQCSSGASLVNCAIPTIKITDFAKLSFNSELGILLIAVVAVNAGWLLLMIASKVLGNESTIRKRNAYYTFWRKAHAHRLTRTWWRRTWMQMKTQHKLLRVLWFRYNVAQDPAALHTGAQKATVLAAIILLKMLLATLFFRPNDNYDNVCVYDCQFADDLIPGTYTENECEEMGGEPQLGSGKSTKDLITDLVYKSLICAVCSLPATVFLDQAFWRTQKLTNAHLARQGEPTQTQRLAVSAVVRYLVDINDLKSAWYEWMMVREMMLVDDIRAKLTGSRLLRLAGNQELLHKVVAKPEREESAAPEKSSRRRPNRSRGRSPRIGMAASERGSERASRRGPFSSWGSFGATLTSSSQVHPEPTSSTADRTSGRASRRGERSSMWPFAARASVDSKSPNGVGRESSRMSGRGESSTNLASKSSGDMLSPRMNAMQLSFTLLDQMQSAFMSHGGTRTIQPSFPRGPGDLYPLSLAGCGRRRPRPSRPAPTRRSCSRWCRSRRCFRFTLPSARASSHRRSRRSARRRAAARPTRRRAPAATKRRCRSRRSAATTLRGRVCRRPAPLACPPVHQHPSFD